MTTILRPTVSAELAGNADWPLERLSCDAAVTIVQLIHRRAAYWTQSNDYEFSRFTMEEHWDSGRADVEINHPEWKSRQRPEEANWSLKPQPQHPLVMAGLVPAIHVFDSGENSWMAGAAPGHDNLCDRCSCYVMLLA